MFHCLFLAFIKAQNLVHGKINTWKQQQIEKEKNNTG
jgi:hypothetical protein